MPERNRNSKVVLSNKFEFTLLQDRFKPIVTRIRHAEDPVDTAYVEKWLARQHRAAMAAVSDEVDRIVENRGGQASVLFANFRPFSLWAEAARNTHAKF